MDGREYCCTNPDKQQCKAGHVIVNVPSALMHQGLSLRTLASNGSSTQIITERFNVSRSGIYYFLIVSCDFEEKDELYLQGECAWKNPYGYLPGDVYMKFPVRSSPPPVSSPLLSSPPSSFLTIRCRPPPSSPFVSFITPSSALKNL